MVDDDRRLVYSSEHGWQAPQPVRRAKTQNRAPEDGILRVSRERRRGSMMSIVTGLADAELSAVAKELKKLCGSGGTAKNGAVEIQGDHRDAIVAFFESRSRRVKKAGG
ncbi:MAG: stress response translation initiation inhibitor YciH [Candidatus Eremiobacteraeota bacterium]|nr:stress response translation initiation inhibitor YciH [Candidatus Eremiobacteraeota bacterium]